MRRGFTLVELSIVLVIIGLLIGGVLAAQSMIETAKVDALVKQVQQFDIATSNFRTQYGQLPGDSSAIGCTNVAGQSRCDNGVIENNNYASTGHIADYFTGEVTNFWPQLQLSGFMPKGGGALTATITDVFKTSGASPNSPELPYKVGAIAFGWQYGKGNFYALCDFTTNSYQITGTSNSIMLACEGQENIPVTAALALDQKIDDGLSDAHWDNVSSENVVDYGSNTCSNGSNSTYDVSNRNAKCSLIIRMLSQQDK